MTAFPFCNGAKITRQFNSNCIFLLPFPITKAPSCRCYHQKLPVKREWLEWVKIWLGKKNLLDTVPDVYRIAILSSELIFWILYQIDLSTWRCSIGFMKWVAFTEGGLDVVLVMLNTVLYFSKFKARKVAVSINLQLKII